MYQLCSVVGGYLAYIGFFCGKAGINLMANTGTDQLSIGQFISTILYTIPGIVGGILIYVAIRTIKHMAVLPTCIFAMLVIFHMLLYLLNASVEDATAHGWIRLYDTTTIETTTQSSSSSPWMSWYHTWDYLRIDLVDWSVIPKILLTEISMIFVVALSSSLDVAAIELELRDQQLQNQKRQYQEHQQRDTTVIPSGALPNGNKLIMLDYNRELQMVGFSNLISGCTGGYTGSYIFSQSIFSLRAGIRSRLAGYILALCQLTIIIIPIPILSYVPNCLFGSLLIMICVDLLYEWLIDVRTKVSTSDFVLCWITFIVITVLGNVEYGIILGCIFYFGYHHCFIGVVYPNLSDGWLLGKSDNNNQYKELAPGQHGVQHNNHQPQKQPFLHIHDKYDDQHTATTSTRSSNRTLDSSSTALFECIENVNTYGTSIT